MPKKRTPVKVVTGAELLDLLRRTGAQQEGHFQLSSGLHSGRYLQCARLLEDPRVAEWLGRELAARLAEFCPAPQAVISPALGGVIIGHEVARAAEARFLFTERDSAGRAMLRRGFALRPHERAVVVEDVVTTGGSTREVIEVARAAGADVCAVGAIIDRGAGGPALFGLPFVSLLRLDAPAFPAGQCEMCRRGLPLEKPGSRK